MAQMAQSKNLITGTITLGSPQTSFVINVPFTPRLCMVVLRTCTETTSNYRQIIFIGGTYENPDGIGGLLSTWSGGYGAALEVNGTSGRTINPTMQYSDGQLTIPTRSASFYWAQGIYDYIVAG